MNSPDPDTLQDAGGPAGDTGGRASFRLAAFAAVLVVVLSAGYGIGRLNDGAGVAGTSSATTRHPAADTRAGEAAAGEHGHGRHTGTTAGSATGAVGAPPAGAAGQGGSAAGGLALTSAGLTLAPETTAWRAGARQTLRFRITGGAGAPVTTFAVVHDRPLHLVVVRRDLSGFQHLHPTMAPDGTWSIGLTLAQPGSHRAIADFTALVGGRQVPTTLGVDLTASGNYAPTALPAPSRQATAGGFAVSYEGAPRVGSSQPLLVTVAGAKLEPYLGAYGHLVVLREGDVGYVHVHPEEQLVDGRVKFWLTAPGPGRYRMFFDFQVAGRVHTAAWTAVVR